MFGVGLEYFFTDERKRHVVAIARKKERLRFPDSPDRRNMAYNFESLDFKATERTLNAFYAEFEHASPERSRPHQHSGVVLLYLVQGSWTSRSAPRRSTWNQGTPCTLIRECVTATRYHSLTNGQNV